MSWETDLALEFKSRNNPKPIGAVLGKVTSSSPLKINILDGQVLLDETNSYVCEKALSAGLIQGDLVLVIPSGDEQSFFIIDIVKGVQ